MNKEYLLSFELDSGNELLEIHANKGGLHKLIEILNSLLEQNENDHVHLMSTDWGGDELTSEKQCKNNKLINHVKVFRW